jgi:hypothetical protein
MIKVTNNCCNPCILHINLTKLWVWLFDLGINSIGQLILRLGMKYSDGILEHGHSSYLNIFGSMGNCYDNGNGILGYSVPEETAS